MPSPLIHVKDKATGHEYVIREHLFNPRAHTKTGKSAFGRDGEPAPTKFQTTVEKAAKSRPARRYSAPKPPSVPEVAFDTADPRPSTEEENN